MLLYFDPMSYGSADDLFSSTGLTASGLAPLGFSWVPDHRTYPALDDVAGRIPGTFGSGFAGTIFGTVSSPRDTLFVGLAIKASLGQHFGLSFYNTEAAALQGGGHEYGWQTGVVLDAGAAVSAFKDWTNEISLGRSGNNAFPHEQYFFLEVGVRIGANSGTIEVRCEGVTILALANIDTMTTGFAGTDQIGISALSLGTVNVCDLYVCDDAVGPGSHPCNTFLGDVRPVLLPPLASVGTPGWTPLSGTNLSQVKELVCDFDATYNSTSSVGATDRYSFPSLPPVIDTVYGVQLRGTYRKDDAGPRQVTQLLTVGGTDVPGNPLPLSVGYVHRTGDLWAVNPATGASWTIADVDALQAGYQLTA